MKTKLWVYLVLVLALIGAVYAASPTVTIEAPSSSGTVTGASAVINVSITGSLNANSTFYNITWNVTCTNNANTSTGSIASANNVNLSASGATGLSFSNLTFNSIAGIEDDTACTFAVGLVNGTQLSRPSSNSTSVTVDNTVPNAATGLNPSSLNDGTTISDWRATVTDRNTTSCSLFYTDTYGIQRNFAMTYSVDNCTSSTQISPGSGASWFVRASDGTNTTDSSTTTFTVTKESGGAAGAYALAQQAAQAAQQQQQTQEKNTKGILLVVLLGGGALWYFTKGGKRRK